MEAAVASNNLTALVEAQVEWEAAAAEYASTPEGNQHLRAQAEASEAAGDFDTMALLNTVVAKGEAMRAANRDAAAFLRAARLSQNAPVVAEPSVADRATGAYGAYVPVSPGSVEPDLGEVPRLSAKEQFEYDSTIDDFNTMLPRVQHIFSGSSPMYASDFERSLPEMVERIGDPAASDEDLAKAVRFAARVRGTRYAHPTWTPETRDGPNVDYALMSREWSDLSPRLHKAMELQARRALGHPNAGVNTFKEAEEFDINPSGHPNAPMEYLVHVASSAKGSKGMGEAGWSRLREARFNDGAVAMRCAVHDPDAFQRNEALNMVMTMNFDTVSADDRLYLARNLGKLPGSEENQRVLAYSLDTWARGYSSADERKSLSTALASSKVASVAEIGRRGKGEPEPEAVEAGEGGGVRRFFGRG